MTLGESRAEPLQSPETASRAGLGTAAQHKKTAAMKAAVWLIFILQIPVLLRELLSRKEDTERNLSDLPL